MRLTKFSKEILKILEKSHTILSASDIHKKLPHINLVTIYRNLEKLSDENLIKKLYLNNQEVLYEKQNILHHHAICFSCDKIIHFTLKDKKLEQKIKIPNFKIESIDIVVRGTCTKDEKLSKN